MTHSKRRVAIVGAGLSGLSTAAQIHLADPNIELMVIEASDRYGGVIGTQRCDGFLIDHGADMFSTEPSGVIELCRKIGIDGELIEPEVVGRGARIVRRGQLVPVPDGFIVIRATKQWPMLTSPLLSPIGKLRFLAERFQPRGGNGDESIGNFVRRRMGREILDRMVAPLAAGIYTGDVDRLSMRATMGPVAEMEDRFGSLAKAAKLMDSNTDQQAAGARYQRFRSFRGGMVQLIEGLASALPENSLRLNSRVTKIRRCDEHFAIEMTTRDGDQTIENIDHVVVAVPPGAAGSLLRNLVPLAADSLGSIESTSTAIAVLGLRRSEITEDISTFGFVVPPSEGRRILAGSFASNKFAGRAPEGHVLVRVFMGGALQSELLGESDERLIEIAIGELRELIGLRGVPVVSRIVRWNKAMPQYHVGHLDRVRTIESAMRSEPKLSLITNAIGGVGIAAVVRSAARIANEVTRD